MEGGHLYAIPHVWEKIEHVCLWRGSKAILLAVPSAAGTQDFEPSRRVGPRL